MTNQDTTTAEKFVFEQVEQKPKEPPEVTIYKNGLVRFSKSAMDKYGLRDAQIVWGENETKDTLAMQKAIGGRAMRGENKDQTSCPLTIAQRHAGKYTILEEGEIFVLKAIVGN